MQRRLTTQPNRPAQKIGKNVMAHDPNEMLRNFEIIDCAVRSDDHFYLLASHVYELEEDDERDEDDLLAGHPLQDDLREAIRVAVYFPNKPSERRWGFRTIRNIEFMKCAVAEFPQPHLVAVSIDGQVYVLGSGKSELEPRIPKDRNGPLRGAVRDVLSIDGMVHAVQGNRGLCRRAGSGVWESLCADLPVADSWQERADQGFRCAAARSPSDLYAGGEKGDLWHFDGASWRQLDFPGSDRIETMCCLDRDIYIGCQNGVVYRRQGSTWKIVTEGCLTLSYQSMVAYRGKVWCSSKYGIWTIEGNRIERADLPDNIYMRSGVLATKGDVLLTAGSRGAAYFDGGHWHVIF